MKMMCLHLLIVFGSLCASASTRSTRDGIIQGVVVDETGNPIAAALVSTRDLDIPKVVVGKVLQTFETDTNGCFTIRNLVVGHRYKLYAMKEEAGYPNTRIEMYTPNNEILIAIAALKGEGSSVRLQIGPKAAFLEYEAKDSITGRSVKSPTIDITRTDTGSGMGGGCIDWNGDRKVLIPCDIDLLVQVSAPGYKVWYYPGYTVKAAGTPLRATPGETKKLDVLLQPN